MLKIYNWDSQDSKAEVSTQCSLTWWDSSFVLRYLKRKQCFAVLLYMIWAYVLICLILFIHPLHDSLLISFLCFCSNCIFNLFSILFVYFPLNCCMLSFSISSTMFCYCFWVMFLVLIYRVFFCTFCYPLTCFVNFIGFIPTASTMEECIVCIF